MLKNIIRKFFAVAGLEIHKKYVKPEQLEMYSRIFTEDSIRQKRFYNMGAGAFHHSCWTNIDYHNGWHNDNYDQVNSGINYDLFSLQPISVESNTAEIVYSSHAIEHVTNDAVQNFFNEAYRMLKPGGFFRIVTPDIDIEYKAYASDDRDYFYWVDYVSSEKDYKRLKIRKPLNKETTAQIFLENFAAQASEIVLEGADKRISDDELKTLFETMPYEQALDYCTSLCSVEIQKRNTFNHINWFNENKLRRMLQQAGFKNVYRSAYGQSFCPVLRDINFFDYTLPKVSLYMEAVK